MNEEKNKAFTVKFKPSLMAKVEDYISIVGSTKASFFNELLSNYFKSKVVNKEFIVPEKKFYFNFNKLIEEGTIEASTDKPSTDFNKYLIVNKIPNNLDSFNTDFNSYCYNDKLEQHKGLFIYYIFSVTAVPYCLLFNYNMKEEKLTISEVKFNELNYLIESEEDVKIIEGIIEDVKANVNLYNNEGASTVTLNGFMKNTAEVLGNFKSKKMIDLLVKYNVNTFSDSSEDLSDLENLPIIELQQPKPED